LPSRIFYVIAYALPAAILWGMLGGLCRLLGVNTLFVMLFSLIYAVGFGLLETFGVPVRVPSSTWQVPGHWVRGQSPQIQTLIWGTLLGPGILTRNPYASIWLLLPLLALSQNFMIAIGIGLAVGTAHGIGRALGILYNRKCISNSNAHLLIMGRYWLWQCIDGLALLVIAGALSTYIFLRIR